MIRCRVCGNGEGNVAHRFREMYFGTGETFEYGECGRCGSLSIADVPADMGRHYPKDYYSLKTDYRGALAGYLKGRRDRYFLYGRSLPGWLVSLRSVPNPYIEWIRTLGLPPGAAILEIGCGTGTMLVNLTDAGFAVLGVDPYVPADIRYPNGTRILKKRIEDMDGRFDALMLHHSLEHVEDPNAVFREARRLLKPGGKMLVRTPVAGKAAWRSYGKDWFQLDAPRHMVILSEAGMAALAAAHGFRIYRTVYDSTASQFWASEQYVRGIACMDRRSRAVDPGSPIFSDREMREFEERATRLNRSSDGDQAAFYLEVPGE
jgi:SAM-dependent methyltransferase